MTTKPTYIATVIYNGQWVVLGPSFRRLCPKGFCEAVALADSMNKQAQQPLHMVNQLLRDHFNIRVER